MASSSLARPLSWLLVSALGVAAEAQADTWASYRGDAARSGYTAEPLPEKLALRWVYRPRHAPRPAWSGRDTRMPFDLAHHVAASRDLVVFGSSVDGKVRALAAATGERRWVFFTRGPVRFAPVLWRDRVFVVSDDGHLYCLAATGGRPLWKRRGGPIDSLVLGNDRMISRWPARGGPAVADGVVYFAAGIWPSEGIFLYALDAATGEVKWCNDTAGGLYMPQPHGGANAKSGISAQGYLVVAGDRLIVPTGRGVPAVFDRATGKFLYFHLQRYGHYGGSGILAAGAHFLNGNALFEVASGTLVHRGVPTAAAAVTPRHLVYALGKELVAVARSALWTQRETTDRKGKKTVSRVLSPPSWRVACPHGASRSLIVVGGAVIACGADCVSVVDMASKKTALSEKLDGPPRGLAAAGGRLFVSTETGAIHCLGEPSAGGPRTIEEKRDASPLADGGPFVAAAEEILRSTGITEGYCLDLACGDGSLACALATRSKLRICAVDADPKQVALARRRLDAAGLLGVQVTVFEGDLARTALPNSFANLVVSGRSVVEGAGVVPADEMGRLQRPYGGVACVGRPKAMTTSVRGAPKGAGEWTHQYSDAGNTLCSADAIVRGPLGLLWATDLNFQMPSRHGRGAAPLFRDGRLFVEGLHGLLAVDAYNGRKLWHHELPNIQKPFDQEHLMGTSGTGSNVCIGDHGLYVRLGGKCLRLDPATGKLLAELQAPKQPDGKPGTWGYIACVGDTLFGSLSNTAHTVRHCYGRSDMSGQFTESLLLFALDAKTGTLRWEHKPEHSIRNNAIAIGGGRVYLIDRPLATGDLRGEATKRPTGALLALDAQSGSRAWTAAEGIYGTMLAYSQAHDVLLMAYQSTRFRIASEVGGRMAAFRGSTGKRLWDIEASYASRPLLNGRTIYAQPGAWDLLTGKPRDFKFARSYGCGILSGSRHLLCFRSATLGTRDLGDDHGVESYGGIRPGCWVNVLPVGGLVLMPDATDRCGCSYLIKASVALQPYGLRPPAISPRGGASRQPVTVALKHARPRVEMRYTLDGTPPTDASPRYTGPLRLAKSATLKARAFAHGMPPSQVATAAFVVDPRLIPIDGPHWKVVDTPGGKPPVSKWQVTDGYVTELSNLYLKSASDPSPKTDRPGTYRVFTKGAALTDGELALEIASTDNDGLGVAFRFQDRERYYLWAMDAQRRFHVLACKDGSSYRILAHKARGYTPGHWYQVRIVLRGPKIAVYLDGEKNLEATDETFGKGTFALYAWGCAGARFRAVRWK